VTAAVGLEFAIEAIAQQCVVVGIRFEVNAAAVAAVAAGGSAARNEFLAPKRNAAVPAVAGLYVDFCFINKHVESVSANSKWALFGARQKRGYDTAGPNCTYPLQDKNKKASRQTRTPLKS